MNNKTGIRDKLVFAFVSKGQKMKKLVMLMLVGLLLPVGALGFDIRCKDYGDIDYFALKTEGYDLLFYDVDKDYHGACRINESYYKNLPMAYNDERHRREFVAKIVRNNRADI